MKRGKIDGEQEDPGWVNLYRLTLCFLWGKEIFFLKKLAIKGKSKNVQWGTRIVDCVLLARTSFMDIWPMQLHRTQHLEAHELTFCSGHLGILNNLSLGDPRVPFSLGPASYVAFPAPNSRWRFCSALLLHSSDFPHTLPLSSHRSYTARTRFLCSNSSWM